MGHFCPGEPVKATGAALMPQAGWYRPAKAGAY